ncbi:MAG: DUF262 domain-containing protein [Alphaproteobacteria bacterium]|nr:DUF262 domain-containing protein [Alphaproteobacteria bacterium]
MQPHKFTIHDVFEKERRYDIPLYQRAYVWNQDDQWEPLWDDIRKQAERALQDSTGKLGSHFLGAAVWSINQVQGRAIAKADVIDGQQRLTTLQLFIAALRDCATEIDQRVQKQAARWSVNPDREGSDEELKVWPTNADRDVFRAVMRAGGPAAVKALYAREGSPAEQALPRMAEAYLYFADVIRQFADEGKTADEKADRIHAIAQAMRTSLLFVVIELEQGDDPQVIFETLNARGQPLLPSDLVRNYVFLKATAKADKSSDKLYENYWKAFDDLREDLPDDTGEDRFWHMLERQGRLTRPRIDLFLFHYLTLHTERELNIGQLFKEFREWHEKGDGNVEKLLADLKTQSARFQQLIAPEGNDRLAVFARRLKALDTSTVYPLLLFLMAQPKDVLPTDQLERAIVDLESFLVRRLICGLTTKNYNKFFLGLLSKAKKAASDHASIADAIRDELLRSEEKTAIWPSDDEFRKAWLSEPIYMKTRTERAAMVLRAIEEVSRTTRNEALQIPTKLSIEHLLPQKYVLSDYPYADSMPIRDDETHERCRSRILHTIGNLTLLTQALNTSVSNGAFAGKSKAIVTDSDLRLNAWLRSGEHKRWSEADIISRGNELFERGLTLWPRPADTRKRTATEPTSTPHFTERLQRLIASGSLKGGDALQLSYKDHRFTGQITGSGIKIADGIFSPSDAAVRCYASVGQIRKSENGWRVWKADGVSLKELLARLGDEVDDTSDRTETTHQQRRETP